MKATVRALLAYLSTQVDFDMAVGFVAQALDVTHMRVVDDWRGWLDEQWQATFGEGS